MQQKQIIYPSFITRIFSTSLDMFLLSVVLTPIMNMISKWLFLYQFKDFVINQGINMNDHNAITKAFNSREFIEYFTWESFLSYFIPILIIQFALIATYFVYFWHKLGFTPGKFILGIRVVDEDKLTKPLILQAFKRFISCTLAIIGIWFIPFTTKKQALHDKLAGTIVIKK